MSATTRRVCYWTVIIAVAIAWNVWSAWAIVIGLPIGVLFAPHTTTDWSRGP